MSGRPVLRASRPRDGLTQAGALQGTAPLASAARSGRPIRTAPWIREGQAILTSIGEGYTTTPPQDGGWETGGGKVRREKTVIVYTYIKPDRFLAHVATLREFLHRFGRETNQEVVVVELSGAEGSWFFRIKEYDE